MVSCECYRKQKEGKFDLIVTREVCRFARNTVDSLNITRTLAEQGVEVYFFNDNIWSMDTDGELRLTIMSALAQEESRKVSERARSGQETSRQRGVLYGNGNILGYKLVRGKKTTDNTYEIIPEQAETVKIMADMCLRGFGLRAISRKLIELKRKNASGVVVWDTTKVGRTLRNRTYCGYKCYGKSYVKNYLSHKRQNIPDTSQHVYVKADFPAILTEEEFDEIQRILDERVMIWNGKRKGLNRPSGRWQRKLVCSCGKRFQQYHWRTNKDGTTVYGYACKNVINNRKKDERRELGVSTEGMCNVKSFPEWKLEYQMLCIVKRLLKNPESIVDKLSAIIEQRQMQEKGSRQHREIELAKNEMDKAEQRLNNLLEMFLDGTLEASDYKEKQNELEKRYNELKERYEELDSVAETPEQVWEERKAGLERIRERLRELTDTDQDKISDELIDRLVNKIVPCPDSVFKWYLNLSDKRSGSKEHILYDSFTIQFEEASAYRKKCGTYLRESQWNDLLVQVYIGV